MSEALVPIPPDDVALPEQPMPTPESLGLSSEGIKRAAKEMGLHAVTVEKLMASYTLGKAIKQVGALKIGRSILLSANEHSQSAIEQCDKIVDRTTDPALALSALEVKQSFVRVQADVGAKFINSVEVDGSDDAGPASKIRAFEPGQAAGPVVIAQQAVVNHTQTT